jgi:hypothetical protein
MAAVGLLPGFRKVYRKAQEEVNRWKNLQARVRPLFKLSVCVSSPSFSLLRAIIKQSSRGFQRSYGSHTRCVQGLGEAQLGSITNVLERLSVSCQVLSASWPL